jgi:hypothetical protein
MADHWPDEQPRRALKNKRRILLRPLPFGACFASRVLSFPLPLYALKLGGGVDHLLHCGKVAGGAFNIVFRPLTGALVLALFFARAPTLYNLEFGLGLSLAADSARCRPPFRNDLAHRSDLISPTIPR